MRKHILGLVLIAQLIPALGQAQKVSGYLGKRMGVQYHASFWPIPYIFFGVDEAEAQGSSFGFRIAHHVEANYVVGRRVQLGVSYQTASVNYYPKEVTFYPAGGYPQEFIPKSKSDYKVQFNTIGGNLRFYVGDFSAPMGNYIKIGYGRAVVSVNGGISGKLSYYDNSINSDVVVDKTIAIDEKFNINRFHIGIGGQRPLSKRFFIDYSTGVNIHSCSDWSLYSKRGRDELPTEETYIKRSVYLPYRAADMIDITLGFGILIF